MPTSGERQVNGPLSKQEWRQTTEALGEVLSAIPLLVEATEAQGESVDPSAFPTVSGSNGGARQVSGSKCFPHVSGINRGVRHVNGSLKSGD